MDIYVEIGRRIAALRRERDLTQEQLAERAGIGDAYVARIEQGRKRPSVEVLAAIAEGLHVPLWRLITTDRLTAEERGLQAVSQALATACEGMGAKELEVVRVVAEALRR